MSDHRIVEVVAGIAASSREPLYAFTSEQVEALKTLGLKMIPVREDRIVEGVLEDLREAGFDVYRLDDMTEEWWCLTHVLPGDRDLNDPDAMKRRCFAHRLNWDRPTWTRLKCRMVRRTVLVPAGGDS